MAITTGDFKREFIRELMKRPDYTRQVNAVQYVTRCPFCGDSQKNFHTGHFYIRCDPSDNYSMVYNCFKCPASGVIDREVIEKLGITNVKLLNGIGKLNKESPSMKEYSKRQLVDGFRSFDFKLTRNMRHRNKLRYIEERLGFQITEEIECEMKAITSLKEFLIANKIGTITCKPFIAQILEDNYIGFLSNGGSHILFRDITGRENISWVKYPIIQESVQNHCWYTVEGSINPLAQDDITINLSEGVFDALGIAYNLHYDKPNVINAAVCGKSYTKIIRRLISQGLFGSNVTLNIFSDNDRIFNKNRNNQDTTLTFYRKALKDYLPIFKEINVYYNTIFKDYGTLAKNISLRRARI